MNIYVDISDLWRLEFVTGIQRTVINVLGAWREAAYGNVFPMIYDPKKRRYDVLSDEDISLILSGQGDGKKYRTARSMDIADFGEGDLLFDIDSIWNHPIRRGWLLPTIKRQGARIATHVYDIIPVTEPQYCHDQTVALYLEYIGAHLTYSDLIITNAQATQDAIDRVLGSAVRSDMRRAVVPLGCDFGGKADNGVDAGQGGSGNGISGLSDVKGVGDIDGGVRAIVEGRSNNDESDEDSVAYSPYVLMVGTLEPRKNHAYVLDAFEAGLFDKGLRLVIAGRPGWNIDRLIDRIERHPQLGRQLFYLNDATDADIAYLYRNAAMVAIASFNEGFGLPIIEAQQYGAPVIASDIPVFREIGGEYCDYFDLSDTADFIRCVESVLGGAPTRRPTYIPHTWRQAADGMYEELMKLF